MFRYSLIQKHCLYLTCWSLLGSAYTKENWMWYLASQDDKPIAVETQRVYVTKLVLGRREASQKLISQVGLRE